VVVHSNSPLISFALDARIGAYRTDGQNQNFLFATSVPRTIWIRGAA
jgi:hypothetical protein